MGLRGDMIAPTYKQLQELCKRKGYRWFTKPYDLNFIGIRSANKTANAFDDTIAVAYVDSNIIPRVFCAPFTCDPGLDYLLTPMNPKGAAIIPEGQYLGLWQLGKHKGYTALVQRKPIQVKRDNDKDNLIEGELSAVAEIAGLNFHRALENDIVRTVGKFSAGCQVVQIPEDFNYIISLVNLQIRYVKSAIVSYTLISEAELI